MRTILKLSPIRIKDIKTYPRELTELFRVRNSEVYLRDYHKIPFNHSVTFLCKTLFVKTESDTFTRLFITHQRFPHLKYVFLCCNADKETIRILETKARVFLIEDFIHKGTENTYQITWLDFDNIIEKSSNDFSPR